MIKKDIARWLYERHGGLSLEETREYTSQLVALLKETVEENEQLTLTHFGKFRHKSKAGREIALPNGDMLRTPPGTRIQFLPSPALKTYLNSEEPDDWDTE